MQNLLTELTSLLKHDERLVVEGKLLKNKIIELALQLDPTLIGMLLSHASIKKHFFQEVNKVQVFDKIRFQKFVSNKAFLPDSYTAFKNKVGLLDDDEFISGGNEVVLAWPYKDCVLEGGQTKEDAKRDELFWNETLAPDQIDRLLQPKAIGHVEFYNKDKTEKINTFNGLNNLLIRGNNLLALHSLKKVYANKVRLIYVDPPFNTGNDTFSYNDKFTHSTWLTFMKNRLEIAKELLAPDGSIFVHLDHNEAHYCKILMDEIFGREHFINEIIWCYTGPGSPGMRQFSRKHDNIRGDKLRGYLRVFLQCGDSGQIRLLVRSPLANQYTNIGLTTIYHSNLPIHHENSQCTDAKLSIRPKLLVFHSNILQPFPQKRLFDGRYIFIRIDARQRFERIGHAPEQTFQVRPRIWLCRIYPAKPQDTISETQSATRRSIIKLKIA